MAILSRVLSSARPLVRAAVNNQANVGGVVQQSVRFSGHRTMDITPSRWAYNKTKDEFHFYFMLGAIPIALVVHYVNIFIGPSELAETPEGYEPEYYEYSKHPITRWLCKQGIFTDHQGSYERMMHHLQEQYEKSQMKRLQLRIEDLQQRRADYQGKFFIPHDTVKYAERQVYERENTKEAHGYMG